MIVVYNELKSIIKPKKRYLVIGKIFLDMNYLKLTKIIIVFSSLSYLSYTFLRNYYSPENIEKRCLLKFEKDFKYSLGKYSEEWEEILDLADNNYFKCMGINQY